MYIFIPSLMVVKRDLNLKKKSYSGKRFARLRFVRHSIDSIDIDH